MKVVSEGDRHRRIFRGTCCKCHSIMEEEEGNLKVIASPDIREPEDFALEKCPVCGFGFYMYPLRNKQ